MANHSDATVGEVEAVFRDVMLPFGLKLDVVRAKGKDIHIKRHPFALELKEPAELLASTGEENLAEFLNARQPGGLKAFSVKLQGQKLHVSASAKILFEFRGTAICSLEIRRRKELWVQLETVDMIGVGSKNLVEKQLEKINPILNAEDFPYDLELAKVDVSEGELILTGLIGPTEKDRE